MSTSTQQVKNHETAYEIEVPYSVAYQGEEGQTPAEEEE